MTLEATSFLCEGLRYISSLVQGAGPDFCFSSALFSGLLLGLRKQLCANVPWKGQEGTKWPPSKVFVCENFVNAKLLIHS